MPTWGEDNGTVVPGKKILDLAMKFGLSQKGSVFGLDCILDKGIGVIPGLPPENLPLQAEVVPNRGSYPGARAEFFQIPL